MAGIRWGSLFPILMGVVAIALGITLLATGNKVSSANVNDAWLILNMTKAGQSQIEITPSNNGPASGNADPNSIQGILNGLINGISNNLTGMINGAVQDLQGQLIGNVTRSLNLKDTYVMFMTRQCEGDYLDRLNPSSEIRITDCYSYDDKSKGLRRISTSIPSTFTVATANVTVPLIQVMSTTLGLLVDVITIGSRFMTAMLVIGVIGTGVAVLGSFVFLAAGRNRPAVVAWTAAALLGSTAFWLLAIAGTAIAYGGSSAMDSGGAALNMSARTTSAFLALAWLAAVFAGLAAMFWWVVWFVEFRRHSYKKRARTPNQIGNYRGIWLEVKYDHTVTDAEPGSKEEAAIMGTAQPLTSTRFV
ncbi:hypothetical protein ACKVWC_004369 [Pyricularia oryzae]|uniref:Sur7 protein n=2 Tax=Pyricularia oryzae TaxID=318829 RepID=A0AA97PPC4_PYRO3|nr:hypothetical protein OOU_Y34scaffold00245g25 [Pyricularia oryzae Y34]KAI7931780.1 hypothetical protein M9X92_000098 [Pyricularia oryzae]KAI7932742.1 hypothetical protein M0657_000051 [Pyricularia oryzae]